MNFPNIFFNRLLKILLLVGLRLKCTKQNNSRISLTGITMHTHTHMPMVAPTMSTNKRRLSTDTSDQELHPFLYIPT